MKKFLQVVILLLFIFLCIKGFLFRKLVKYEIESTRTFEILRNAELKNKIEKRLEREDLLGVNDIAGIAAEFTNEHLSFSFENLPQNNTAVIQNTKANCVGYARLFNSICHFIIEKKKLKRGFEAKHVVGKIYFLGLELNALWENPFFADHDFVMILDKNRREVIYFDPSLYDVFGIGEVVVR